MRASSVFGILGLAFAIHPSFAVPSSYARAYEPGPNSGIDGSLERRSLAPTRRHEKRMYPFHPQFGHVPGTLVHFQPGYVHGTLVHVPHPRDIDYPPGTFPHPPSLSNALDEYSELRAGLAYQLGHAHPTADIRDHRQQKADERRAGEREFLRQNHHPQPLTSFEAGPPGSPAPSHLTAQFDAQSPHNVPAALPQSPRRFRPNYEVAPNTPDIHNNALQLTPGTPRRGRDKSLP